MRSKTLELKIKMNILPHIGQQYHYSYQRVKLH